MAKEFFLDCDRDAGGRPVRSLQWERERRKECVYCGAERSAPCLMPPLDGGQRFCTKELDNLLSECGLSETDLIAGQARAFTVLRNEDGEQVETDRTGAYRLRSPLERNHTKRKIPVWKRNDAVILMVMRDMGMSRRKALRVYRAIRTKWRSFQRIRASAKTHAASRKDLERFRQAAEDLKQRFVAFGLTSEEVDAIFSDPHMKSPYAKDEPVFDDYREYAERFQKLVGNAECYDALNAEQRHAIDLWMKGLLEETFIRVLKAESKKKAEAIYRNLVAPTYRDLIPELDPTEVSKSDDPETLEALRKQAESIRAAVELHEFLCITPTKSTASK